MIDGAPGYSILRGLATTLSLLQCKTVCQYLALTPIPLRFVAISEEPAQEPMPAIEPARVGILQPFHSGHQVGVRRLQHQMVVIAH